MEEYQPTIAKQDTIRVGTNLYIMVGRGKWSQEQVKETETPPLPLLAKRCSTKTPN